MCETTKLDPESIDDQSDSSTRTTKSTKSTSSETTTKMLGEQLLSNYSDTTHSKMSKEQYEKFYSWIDTISGISTAKNIVETIRDFVRNQTVNNDNLLLVGYISDLLVNYINNLDIYLTRALIYKLT